MVSIPAPSQLLSSPEYIILYSIFLQGFARRALSKINELSQLESMSNSAERMSTESSFRQATIKVLKLGEKYQMYNINMLLFCICLSQCLDELNMFSLQDGNYGL